MELRHLRCFVALAEELQIEGEGSREGAPGARPLAIGDLVALKKGNKPKGHARFGHSTDGCVYRIKEVLGVNTYALETLTTGEAPVSSQVANRFSAFGFSPGCPGGAVIAPGSGWNVLGSGELAPGSPARFHSALAGCG